MVQSEVWANSKLDGTALLLLLAIADFSNDEGVAFPSIATLARKIRTSPRNVNHLLVRLKKAHELEIREGQGPHGTNLYRVKASSGMKDSSGMKSSAVPLKGLSSTPENLGQNPLKGLSANPSIEPSVTTKEPSKGNGRRKKTAAPAELEITDSMRAWAETNGITVNLEDATEHMLDHFRAIGETRLDWIATWRTWMRNTKRFGARNGNNKHFETTAEANERVTRQAGASFIRRVADHENGNGARRIDDGSPDSNLFGEVIEVQPAPIADSDRFDD